MQEQGKEEHLRIALEGGRGEAGRGEPVRQHALLEGDGDAGRCERRATRGDWA